jgi:hypothetical protein
MQPDGKQANNAQEGVTRHIIDSRLPVSSAVAGT